MQLLVLYSCNIYVVLSRRFLGFSCSVGTGLGLGRTRNTNTPHLPIKVFQSDVNIMLVHHRIYLGMLVVRVFPDQIGRL